MRGAKQKPAQAGPFAEDMARARTLISDALQLIESNADLDSARRELQLELDAMDALLLDLSQR